MKRRGKKSKTNRQHRAQPRQRPKQAAGAVLAPAPPPLQRPTAAAHKSAGSAVLAVPVWDLAVRLFHWSLVIGVGLAWLSGGTGGRVHEVTGYTVAGLVAFRLVWGFAGTRYARFADFVHSPARILAYLRCMSTGRPPRSLGHNPAGGAMILLLLALIAILSATGWLMLTPQFFGVPWVETLHELAADALVLAVPLHIAGVVASSLMHRENLVGAMVTGNKPVSVAEQRGLESAAPLRPRAAPVQQGIALLMLLALLGFGYGWATTARRVSSPVVEHVSNPSASRDEIPAGR